MVFFTCAHCGESVKKPKVEKHYMTVCSRNPVSLTCIDCCKDFSAETYPAHTKCVTEEERYSAKGFQPKPSSNKGEQRQQKWQEVIESVLNCQKGSLSQNERFILELLMKHENVPRKKNKFQNFLRSILNNRYSASAADSVFDKLEAQAKSENENPNNNQQKEAEKENESTEVKEDEPAESAVVEEEKLSKKRKKEIRKRAKYEAELKEILSNQMEGENGSDNKKKKKSKKEEIVEAVEGLEEEGQPKTKKKKKADSQENDIEENGMPEQEEVAEGKKSKKKHKKDKVIKELGSGAEENGVSEEVEPTEGKKSKKKHKKEENIVANGDLDSVEDECSKKSKKKRKNQIEIEEEPYTKKIKESTEDAGGEAITKAGKSKFNWQDMIKQVLSAKEEKEMPLKRLRKKVLTEFESMGCGSATDEKSIAKFNKKVHHTPGVVVLKDTVKLVSVE